MLIIKSVVTHGYVCECQVHTFSKWELRSNVYKSIGFLVIAITDCTVTSGVVRVTHDSMTINSIKLGGHPLYMVTLYVATLDLFLLRICIGPGVDHTFFSMPIYSKNM